ncbi:MAG: hypothetical protein IKK39_09200 [Thermoguttaceae bacterium]|nr:hypothetical protein [Thermoguttaceae bacterium]MBR4104220.1 hypothetical protein [Thermoguttaceae bacterium]
MKKENEKKKAATSWSGVKWDAAVVAVSGFALLADVCGWNPWGWSVAWIAVVLCGVPILGRRRSVFSGR